ncbi:MAG TPA: hypothetical protein ENH94_01255 [Phycisphaerales bacterium]|nr:hypothetical protein [Phycisphaerales bacterium]
MKEKGNINDVFNFDACPSTLKDSLKTRIEETIFRRIKFWERLLLIVVIILCFGGGLFCAVCPFVDSNLTSMQRFYLFSVVPLAAVGVLWCASTLKRGTFDIIKDDIRIPTAVWTFLTVILVVEILTGQTENTIIKTVAAFVAIGFPMTWDRMKASALRTQETILRIALYKSDLSNDKSDLPNEFSQDAK